MLKAYGLKPVRDTQVERVERQNINPKLKNKKRSRNVPPQAKFPAVATAYVPFLSLCTLSSFHFFSPLFFLVRPPSASAAR